jgi:hypothetical protein
MTIKQLTVTEPIQNAVIFQRCHHWKYLEILDDTELAAIAGREQP